MLPSEGSGSPGFHAQLAAHANLVPFRLYSLPLTLSYFPPSSSLSSHLSPLPHNTPLLYSSPYGSLLTSSFPSSPTHPPTLPLPLSLSLSLSLFLSLSLPRSLHITYPPSSSIPLSSLSSPSLLPLSAPSPLSGAPAVHPPAEPDRSMCSGSCEKWSCVTDRVRVGANGGVFLKPL